MGVQVGTLALIWQIWRCAQAILIERPGGAPWRAVRGPVMSSRRVLRSSEQIKCLFVGLVAFINAFVGMVGYRCLSGVPANVGVALGVVMVLVSLLNALDFLVLVRGWRSQDWAVDVVPYADIWHVQHGQPSAQYLSYYGYT